MDSRQQNSIPSKAVALPVARHAVTMLSSKRCSLTRQSQDSKACPAPLWRSRSRRWRPRNELGPKCLANHVTLESFLNSKLATSLALSNNKVSHRITLLVISTRQITGGKANMLLYLSPTRHSSPHVSAVGLGVGGETPHVEEYVRAHTFDPGRAGLSRPD